MKRELTEQETAERLAAAITERHDSAPKGILGVSPDSRQAYTLVAPAAVVYTFAISLTERIFFDANMN
jgi:hypothetical protein